MATKKRVFISFDYDNDGGAKTMLAGQSDLEDSPFEFVDASVKEHLTGDWKAKVERRMSNADLVIVLCGQSTNIAAGVTAELSIAQSLETPYFFLAAYSDVRCVKPKGARDGDKLYNWTWDNVKNLIDGSR